MSPARELPGEDESSLAEKMFPRQIDNRTFGIASLAAVVDRHRHPSNHYSSQNHPRNRVLHEYSQNNPRYVNHVQKNLHSLASRTGFPWPMAWGTSPWALSTLASRMVGKPYMCGLWALGGYERIMRAVEANIDSFIFVGRYPMVARHVITVFGKESQKDRWMIFEPSVGEVFSVNVDDVFQAPAKNNRCPKPEFGGWNRPILTVTPKVKSQGN